MVFTEQKRVFFEFFFIGAEKDAHTFFTPQQIHFIHHDKVQLRLAQLESFHSSMHTCLLNLAKLS